MKILVEKKMENKKKPTTRQKQIIEATEGNIRVGAVPGSGKTFVLTNRIAYLIQELYVEPSSIVALTFTNKAAGEMKKRLQTMISDMATCFMGTFHGFCNLILKEEIHCVGYPKTFVILDKRNQLELIREISEENEITLKELKAKDLVDKIAQWKQSEDYIHYMINLNDETLNAHVNKAQNVEECMFFYYLKKQRDNYALDFEDMLQLTLYLLKSREDILKKWQEKCQYVLCDEYQDVNEAQEMLITLLSGKYHNLTVVGDDDQCIYGWRGSQVEYMVDFHKAHEKTKDFTLSENFRSTPEIIKVANSLIKENHNRLLKTMFTNNSPGKQPVFYLAETEKKEAEFIADGIGNSKEYSYSDCAILVRAASQTRALEEAFIREKIPYKILSGAQFYSSEEIRTVLSYLRLVYALNDLDFLWAIQHPRRGFGKKSIEELKRYAGEKGFTLMEALGAFIEQGLVKKKQMISFYENIMFFHDSYEAYSAKELVNKVLDLGYRKELENDVDQVKIDNVTELIHTVAELEKQNMEILPLGDLLAYFSLFSAQDDDTNKNAVRIMTIHTAKGLEFPVVFIPGMVEGQFPSKRLRNSDEIEEERRLFYVAITRAKKELYISSYRTKVEGFPVWCSRFMEDIDYPLLEHIGIENTQKKKTEQPRVDKTEFKTGDHVIHPAFGEGTIININQQGQYYEIDFPKLNGTRQIVFRAKLKGKNEEA